MLGSAEVFSQSIVAGQIPESGHYYDFSPDTTLLSSQNFNNYQLDLDLNNDGEPDFEIYTYNYGGNGGWSRRISIESYNDNEVAYSFSDSCFAGPSHHFVDNYFVCRAFDANDTIKSAANWTHEDGHLNHFRFGVHVDSLDNNYSFTCKDSSFTTPAKYIGVRIISSDTLYGWIKVSGTASYMVTIEEHASQSVPTSLNESIANSIIELFPNPCQEYIQVRLTERSMTKGTMYLQNSLGQVIRELQINTNSLTIETSTLPTGLYYITLMSNNQIHTRRILKTP